jgi:hypothetical protein
MVLVAVVFIMICVVITRLMVMTAVNRFFRKVRTQRNKINGAPIDKRIAWSDITSEEIVSFQSDIAKILRYRRWWTYCLLLATVVIVLGISLAAI